MGDEAVVIGSGAAGRVAWELARQGWDVTVLERGRNLRPLALGYEVGMDADPAYRQHLAGGLIRVLRRGRRTRR
jgi:choline dehydrogenase-like flavoprotein